MEGIRWTKKRQMNRIGQKVGKEGGKMDSVVSLPWFLRSNSF
jgi:hypothetical protein